MTNLQTMLDAQNALQQQAYGNEPAELLANDVPAAVNFVHWNVTALTDELHELLAETSWKPWTSGEPYINITAAKGELVDAFHFLMNLALVLGMDADELEERYFAKREKNIARQDAGYDGVSTKCPGCRRALDDAGVDCAPFTAVRDGKLYSEVYCAKTGQDYTQQAAK